MFTYNLCCISEMSRILTENYSASELAEKFELADTNDDGKLSMEEYLKAV